MNKDKLILFVIIIITTLLSCNTTDPPYDKSELMLKFEDVSCTEAWLTLTTTNLQLPTTLSLSKDDNVFKTINLQTSDTLLYIDSLLPNQTYKFQLSGIGNPASGIKSNVATATTLDTTSHNFTFETWTFGEIGSSVLYDVAIIDENNIWAVGIIQTNDSLGNPDPNAYNAVHWNGNEWKLYKLQFYTFCGQTHTGSYPAKSIFAFNNNEIFISSGSQVTHISGTTQIKTECIPVSVDELWGTDKNNLYAVGFNGQIGWYNGSQWRRIESGISSIIGDIWGVPDGNGNYNKYCGAAETLLKIDSANIVQIITAEQGHSISSVWGKSDKLIYTAGGSGISLYKNYKWEKVNSPDINSIYGIKGNNYNNVVGLSATNMFIHFNGIDWQFINVPAINVYYRLDVKENIVAGVGWQEDRGVITIGRRN